MKNWFAKEIEDLKKRYQKKPLGITTELETDWGRVCRDITIAFAALSLAFLIGLFAKDGYIKFFGDDEPAESAESTGQTSSADLPESKDRMLVLSFSATDDEHGSKGSLIVHKGTLVKVRLQNLVEAFESVPVFATVISHSLGRRYFGATLIGRATADSATKRIKISFSALKPRNSNLAPLELEGQALSLDGTLGLRAQKTQTILQRSLIRGGSSLLEDSSNNASSRDGLTELLTNALVRGLKHESSADLGVTMENASVLTLNPGKQFLVQLTESLHTGGAR